jgi:hypothetical protein
LIRGGRCKDSGIITGKVEKKKDFSVAKNGLLKRYISDCFWLIYGRRVEVKKMAK